VTAESKQRELQELQARVQQLEIELAREESKGQWPPKGYYTAYHVLAGFVLGMFGAVTSLLFNVVGSLLVGQHPLHLIQIYLTFPLGSEALTIDGGLSLAIGCCLYLGTGMLLGIVYQVVLTKWFPGSSFATRFSVVSGLSLAVWIINYYLILSWLQPAIFGGRWIVDLIPWWVAALTHLVFGWTMLLVQPLGVFVPYHSESEEAGT
jgi:hypothetical protein